MLESSSLFVSFGEEQEISESMMSPNFMELDCNVVNRVDFVIRIIDGVTLRQ